MATLNDLDWNSVCEAIASVYGTDAQTIATTLTNNGVALGDTEAAFKMLEGTSYEIWYNSDGTVRSYNYVGMPETYLTKSNSAGAAQLINSNANVSTKTAVKIPLNTTASVTEPTKTSWKAGMAQTGNFVLKEILPAIAAANVGITLGKTIDSALYNANPDFWDSQGWGSINPETWGTITQDDDSLGAKVFNTVFKIDPQTNTSQAYMDQEAFAYLALVMQRLGVFATGGIVIDDPDILENITNTTPPFIVHDDSLTLTRTNISTGTVTSYIFETVTGSNVKYATFYCLVNDTSMRVAVFSCSTEPYTYTLNGNVYNPEHSTIKNKDVYYQSLGIAFGANPTTQIWQPLENEFDTSGPANPSKPSYIAYAILYGTASEVIEGIGTQSGATTPQLNNNDTVAEVLAKLQTQYPDLFNNAVTQDVVQPDGSIKTYTYIPVAQSVTEENLDPGTQPVSGNSTQANPEVDPETATEAQLEYIIGLLTEIANPNIENTGEGNTPPVVIPTGSASALYTVYNPTESEIQSFGGWLWSANFVDQLLKMFNDPMQAIISLHKVFCSPSVSGRNNIKVGYLDSGVGANVVSAQYVTVDCGTVNLSEDYKNVFDYPPFTDVTIYLPFVGFVRLDTNDVMRGSINVVYHIDVLTGACLAEVKVIRDSYGGVMYQYSGDCSVHYPLSSGSYMGIVSALLGVAGTVASGGALAPMAIGMAAGAMRGHANVERSGSLSGNAGAMGIKKPYLVVQRPQVNTAVDFEKFEGKPSNYTVTIGECTGYIKCKEVHVINTPATESETQELVTLLKQGVIL